MILDVALLSKPGGRSRNEDACGYWTSSGGCCWVLSDGVGGHGGGDVASKTVVSAILREFAAAPTVSPAAIPSLITRANDLLVREQKTRHELHDMRATAAVLMIDQRTLQVVWGHLGDSRIYCFRGGRVLAQSRDHSVMQSLVDAGYIDAAELRHHPQRSLLLYALGSTEPMQPSVTPQPLALRDGDVFLLCSDGLWEYVEEPAMEALLRDSLGADAWLAALERELLAHAKSDHDNYSAIAVRVGGSEDVTRIRPA